jgi:hypothetical protein
MNLSATIAPFDVSAIAAAFPRVERAGGTLEASLSLKGSLAAPVYTGEAHLRKGELSVRGFPMPLNDANVDVAVGGDEIRVLRGTAHLGGGSVTIAGRAPIHGFRVGDVTAQISGRGISVPIAEGIELTCDADLRAAWIAREGDEEERPMPRISGDVVLTSFNYTRPIGINADLGAMAKPSVLGLAAVLTIVGVLGKVGYGLAHLLDPLISVERLYRYLRKFHAFDARERPQRLLQLQHMRARPLRRRVPARCALRQPQRHVGPIPARSVPEPPTVLLDAHQVASLRLR